jgi:O-antigen ligase
MQLQAMAGKNPRVRDLTYYLLLTLSLFSLVDRLVRDMIGSIPHLGFLGGLWNEGLIFLLYVAFFLKSRAEGRMDWKATRLHWLILATFVAAVLSMIANWIFHPMSLDIAKKPYTWVEVHATVSSAIYGIRALLEYTLYFFVLNALIDDEDTVRDMMHVLLVAATAVAAYGIYQKLSGMETPKSWTYSEHESGLKIRVFSTIGNPNSLGGYMVLVAPIAAALTLWAKNWSQRLIYGAASLIMIACLVLTYSRGAWIGFVAAMVLYTIITRNKWLAIIGIAGIAIVPFAAPSLVDRLTLAFTPEYIAKAGNKGRVEFWGRAFKIWQKSPIFGAGIGTVGDTVALKFNMPGATWIDNQYMRVLAETGLLGIIAYVSMLAAPVIRGAKFVFFGKAQKGTYLYALCAGITAAIFGMIVENFTAGIFENEVVITTFWPLIALLYVATRLAAQKANA